MNIQEGIEVATFAGGCFGVQAVFLELEGVIQRYFRLHWRKGLIQLTKKYVEAKGHAEAN
jgi:peptide methionine sulfoxide reductase MsrA